MHTDRELQEQILTALEWVPGLDVAHMGVTVNQGNVRLEGVVATWLQKSAAEGAARYVDGVRGVATDLEISPDVGPSADPK
jgi:osmotically-inducible protein OsmY